MVSLNSSPNLFTNLFLHLQFLQSNYSLKSHDLLHSHSQLLGFQIKPLSHTLLLISSLHSHLHLFLFQRCLLLQTIASNLHSHLHVSCHFIFFVSLVQHIRLNNLTFKSFTTSGTHFCVRIINIITIATTFTCFNAKRIKYRIIIATIIISGLSLDG